MRKSAIGFYVSIAITIFSVFIILLGVQHNINVLENIGYGVLGSGIVSVVMMLSEYFVAKRDALEKYYIVASETINFYKQCIYIKIDTVDFLMSQIKFKYYTAEALNIDKKEVIKSNSFNDFCNLKGINEEARDTQLLIKIIDEFGKRDEEIKKYMNRYITAVDFGIKDLAIAYGDIYFLLNKKKYKKIYKEIQKPIQDLYESLFLISSHLKAYTQGNDNNCVVAFQHLNEAYSKTYRGKFMDKIQSIYQTPIHKISENIEKLRCYIYWEKYKETKEQPQVVYYSK